MSLDPSPSAPMLLPLWRKPSTRAAACALLALAAAAAASAGGLAGVLAALTAAALAVAARQLTPGWPVMRGEAHVAEPAAPEATAVAQEQAPRPAAGGKAGRIGAEVMVSEVVPVWGRQMQVTREASSKGIDQLLETFGTISTSLDELSHALDSYGASTSPGAIDGALEAGAPAVKALLAPSARAFAERDAMVAVLGRCADALAGLQLQAKQAREIARHTRLVAFNASIEATRVAGGSAGTMTVANELRTVAARIAETDAAIDRQVLALSAEVGNARRDGEIHDTAGSELALELDLKAREAMGAMLSALGSSLRSSSALRDISQALRRTIDEAFVQFQFGDRVAQMLDIVGRDMAAFAAWVAAHPHATQSDAADWLHALQAAYTMEEQRSQHHGNVHVERESEIEYF